MKIKKSAVLAIAALSLILTGCLQPTEQEIFTDSVYSTAHTYDGAIISTLNDTNTGNLRVNLYKDSNPSLTLDCNVKKLQYLYSCQSEDKLNYVNFNTKTSNSGRTKITNVQSATLREDGGEITSLLCQNDKNNRASFVCVPSSAFGEAKKGSITQR